MFDIPGPAHLRHRIGDAWVAASAGVVEIRNPADPSQLVATAPYDDPEAVPAAISSAREALPGWSRLAAHARAEFLFRAAELLLERADVIARDLTREEGKTIGEANGEVRRAAAIFRYCAGRASDASGEVYPSAVAGTRIQTIREPIGVVAIVTPWNFPIAIPAWKIAPALAYGNTVVFKSASATPLTAQRLVEALIDAGLPTGVLNLVHVLGERFGRQWVAAPGVAGLSFTGSAATGRRLADQALASGVKVQLELGGKNAVVVARDADLELAANAIVRGAFASAGQKCTATSRVIAVRDIAGPLREAIVERVGRLLPGDPLEPSTNLGPVIDLAARDRIAGLVAAARADGAMIAGRSGAHQIEETGAFAPAVVLDRVDPAASIAREEVFGPVLVLLEATDLDQAIRLHNDVAYGLSGSIFTRSLVNADRFVRAARVGIVHVNGETAGAEPHVPFGGMKASSSWSREQGHAAEDFYTQTKTTYWDGLGDTGPFDLG
ncbi:MAG: aldehyde dehydrogenase family protein [Candidatus Limnocylindrales bacterium]